MITNHVLTDDFGRQTVFKGTQLVDDHTDTEEGRKPQWLEVTIWRTEAGNFVVRRSTCYRIVHATENCSRADGYVLVPATEEDTYACTTCNKHGALSGFGQAPRISVEVYTSPEELIDSFRSEGRYSHLARSILSELAALDEGIDKAWSVVYVA